ncbi:MAG: hypothetical protein K8S16_17230 [Bacteroidales bacterium]|nr:hypothetical protein [Bacteroidales bacterium]
MFSTIQSVILKFTCVIILLTACSKQKDEGDGWESCLGCNIESWIGNFSGSGEFKNLNTGNTSSGVQVSVEIIEISENYLQVKILVPNYYSTTIYGTYVGSYSISLASSTNSFSGSLQKKDNILKLIGESKQYVEKVNELVIEKTVIFEALKE